MRGIGRDDSIARMREHGETLRDRSSQVLDAAMAHFDEFRYVSLSEINPEAYIPHNRSAIRDFALNNGLDLVLIVHGNYERREKGLWAEHRLIRLRLFSQVFDARGDFLGSIQSEAEEPIPWQLGFDARDPAYLEGFVRILKSAVNQNLEHFRAEVMSKQTAGG